MRTCSRSHACRSHFSWSKVHLSPQAKVMGSLQQHPGTATSVNLESHLHNAWFLGADLISCSNFQSKGRYRSCNRVGRHDRKIPNMRIRVASYSLDDDKSHVPHPRFSRKPYFATIFFLFHLGCNAGDLFAWPEAVLSPLIHGNTPYLIFPEVSQSVQQTGAASGLWRGVQNSSDWSGTEFGAICRRTLRSCRG